MRMKGRLRFSDPSAEFSGFATDSRAVEPGKVFLAIKGAKVDGHAFVADVTEKGAAASVVTMPVPYPSLEVEDLVQAIARYGHSLRREFSRPVVGVTGSNGKTTTKEFIAAALGGSPGVVKTQGNQNTEYTSPLLWTGVSSDTSAVVVEMGMRGYGQIAHLANVADPTVGVITCIGTAHIEMVGSREGIAKAKAELLERLTGAKVSVLWSEDDFLNRLKEYAPGPVVTFGTGAEADVRVVGYRALESMVSHVLLDAFGSQVSVELPTIGRHQSLNAAAALAVAVTLGEKVDVAASRLAQAELPPMRMQKVPCAKGTVLLDAYNASPDSTIAALNTLAELEVKGRKIAVLGEMRELGDHSEEGHRAVGRALVKALPDAVCVIGPMTDWLVDEAVLAGYPRDRILIVDNTAPIVELLSRMDDGDLALVKGSRALGMEKVVLEACS